MFGERPDTLPERVVRNIDFARANKKTCIIAQAVLEGIEVSGSQAVPIIDSGTANGVAAVDVQKIRNLKHAREFVLDRDVAASPTDSATSPGWSTGFSLRKAAGFAGSL